MNSVTASSLALLLSFTAAPVASQSKDAAPARASVEHYNLGKRALAIEGYDPVAYFEEGGGEPEKGSKDITVAHRGVTYRFSSAENKKTFLASPERFEPEYGGWCAYAMADGKQVDVDPKSFLIEDGRLLLFYKGLFNDTRKKWRKEGGNELGPKADGNWTRISGEGAARDLTHFNLKDGVGLSGYDPVRYFMSDVEPAEGKSEISITHDGVTYRFVDAPTREIFRASPGSFEPHYGGYCAWAMAQGKKVEIDPEAYVVDDSGLFLFFNASKRDEWKAAAASMKEDADREWEKLHRSDGDA